MRTIIINRAKLGAFVIIAIGLLVIGLYYIGSKKNIFNSTIEIGADFNNVGGIMPGNNVRFNGIDVGTVSEVYPTSDTIIRVYFSLRKEATKFITQSAIASIGTDGLLGNKIINLAPGSSNSKPLQEGDILKAVNPIQIENALRTLVQTNDNLNAITQNLKGVSEKFYNENSLWHLLTDTVVADNVRKAIVRFKITGENSAMITGDLREIVKQVSNGKGSIGALLTDTNFSHKLNQTIVKIESISDSVAFITGNFKDFSEKLKNENGAVGTLITDTMFVHDLNESIQKLKLGADNFNQNMEALKHTWPLRRYFKAQQKK